MRAEKKGTAPPQGECGISSMEAPNEKPTIPPGISDIGKRQDRACNSSKNRANVILFPTQCIPCGRVMDCPSRGVATPGKSFPNDSRLTLCVNSSPKMGTFMCLCTPSAECRASPPVMWKLPITRGTSTVPARLHAFLSRVSVPVERACVCFHFLVSKAASLHSFPPETTKPAATLSSARNSRRPRKPPRPGSSHPHSLNHA